MSIELLRGQNYYHNNYQESYSQSKISSDHREHKMDKLYFYIKSTEGLTLTLTLLGMTRTVEE